MFDYSLHDYDYETDDNEEPSINARNRSEVRNARRSRFSALQNSKLRSSSMSRMGSMRSLGSMGGRLGAAASTAVAPMMVMATAMSVSLRIKEYNFDRTALQSDIKSMTDLLVSESPTAISLVAFGLAEHKLSGKFSGSAGSFIGKRFRLGGGMAGKAVSMVGGLATYMIADTILKPIQTGLSNTISSWRSTGLMSSIAKGSVSQSEASIRAEAASKGITSEEGIANFAKGKNLPTGVSGMTTRQMLQGQREMERTLKETEGGFFNALFKGKVSQWTEELDNQKGLRTIAEEKSNRRMNFLSEIYENNKVIIDFYSRE